MLPGTSALYLRTALAALLVTLPVSAQTALATTEAKSGDRAMMDPSDGWRFRQNDTVTGVEAIGFPDGDWASVSLPHSWKHVGVYGASTPGRLDTPERINKAQGVGWYRLRFIPDVRGDGRGQL